MATNDEELFSSCEEVLDAIRKKSPHDQMILRHFANKAFRELWISSPSSEEFAAHTEGLVLTPEMLFTMAVIKNDSEA